MSETILHVFDVHGCEEEMVIAHDAADARRVMEETFPPDGGGLDGAAFEQCPDGMPFVFCEDEERKNPVTKTCGEWAREKGRGYFATTY